MRQLNIRKQPFLLIVGYERPIADYRFATPPFFERSDTNARVSRVNVGNAHLSAS
jgi:hypothetical protein